MKKGIALFLVMGLVFTMFGCGKADEPTEGAPVVEEGRFIDEEKIDYSDLTGYYAGITYPLCELEMYPGIEEGDVEVGSIVVYDENNELVYWGHINEVMTNYYEIKDSDVTISAYTDNGTIGLDLYEDGEHVDYYIMTSSVIGEQ